MLWYIMDVYTSYIIGITKKHNFYLITHTGTLEIQFFKEIGGNMVRIVFRKNYFKSQLLLESAATTIRDTIMIFSTMYHTMVCVTPTKFQHPRFKTVTVNRGETESQTRETGFELYI